MFISRNGAELKEGMLVGIHFNKHRNDYSVVEFKSKRTEGKVLGYIKQGKLSNVYQVISKSEQKRVIETGQKNRHAYLVGNWEGFNCEENYTGEVYYNPREVDRFVDKISFKFKGKKNYIENVEFVQFELLEHNEKIRPFVTYK